MRYHHRTIGILDTSTLLVESAMDKPLCLCFPCLLYYLGGYIESVSEDQFYPVLEIKGFSDAEQNRIASEWYWVSFERETAVKDYLEGYVTFRDGCWWRPPPQLPRRALSPQLQPRAPRELPRRSPPGKPRRRQSSASRGSSSSGPSS